MSACIIGKCSFARIAIILMGKKELVAMLNLSSWCLVIVEWLFLAKPWGCLRFVILVFLIIPTYYICNFRTLDLFKEFPCEEFLDSPDAIEFEYYG